MSCLECKHSIVNSHKVECFFRLPMDIQDFHKPETCHEGERENNSFGKRFGMRRLLLFILKDVGRSLSEKEYKDIQHQESVTQFLLSTFDIYEKKLTEQNIVSSESNEIGAGRACLSCSYASTDEHHLNLQCSHFHNDINPMNKGCEKPMSPVNDHMIREKGLANVLDYLLVHESTLWLFLHDEWTSGEKWYLILSTYEQTIQNKEYQLMRPKKKRLRRIDSFKRLEDDIVY